ncbi:thioredoxin domain-containing protein 17-like [Ptychodera flava]|uniref:thioredoxin domain-containing protein 17-like n=1 Tax=Ptychodera flava TaxID=63121 RepID=UPI003969F559
MSSVFQVLVESVDELNSAIKEHEANPNTFLFFTGALGPSCESWCDDCRDADPNIEKGLENVPEGSIFILCIVGDEAGWNDPNNEFKNHPSIKVLEIPTLLRLSTKETLGPKECKNGELVQRFFRG